MRICSIKKRQGGNTIMETLIATTVLAVMGMGVLGSINYGMLSMRLARENARATQILLEKTEALRLYNWSQLTNAGVPSTFTAHYDPQKTNDQGIAYNGTMYVGPATNVATSYAYKMRQFTVTLQWTTAGHINHSRSLTTLCAQDGLQNYVY